MNHLLETGNLASRFNFNVCFKKVTASSEETEEFPCIHNPLSKPSHHIKKNKPHKTKRAYLKCIHISQSVLDVAVHHQLSQPQDLSAQMESVPKTGFFSFLDKTKHSEFM